MARAKTKPKSVLRRITERQLATIMAALKYWEVHVVAGRATVPRELCDCFLNHAPLGVNDLAELMLRMQHGPSLTPECRTLWAKIVAGEMVKVTRKQRDEMNEFFLSDECGHAESELFLGHVGVSEVERGVYIMRLPARCADGPFEYFNNQKK